MAATCVASSQPKVTVTWGSVLHDSSYSVYQSTTSATSGFTVTATGISATSWTSGSLSAASYWFEVVAVVGGNWVSATSVATAKRTISPLSPRCS